MRKILLFFLTVLMCSFYVFGQSFFIPKEHYYYQVKMKVARVIDGDTFVLVDSTHVKLLGVNTPELEEKNIEDSLFADSAAHFLKMLIDKKIVKLTFDRKLYGFYGRLLAYVWLTNTEGRDSLFIQAELLKAGLARMFYYPKTMKYYYIFQNLKRTARRKALGIWGIKR
jgi:endonuclease YncB( thermonuclease family)